MEEGLTMKKNYETPEFEVLLFEGSDIVMTSGGETDANSGINTASDSF